MMYQKHGFKIAIDLNLFSNIINKALGLEKGTVTVVQAATHGYSMAVEICVITHDSKFPKLEEGKTFTQLYPHMSHEVTELTDGSTRIERSLIGIEGIAYETL